MKKSSGAILLFLSLVYIIVMVIMRLAWGISFNINCAQYLKRAADANSVDLAKQNLESAIAYLEKHNLTNGVVSVFLHQPQNDVGYWYANLKACQAELGKVSESTTQLERTNLLMKLRETLLDSNKEGFSVTHPDGISAYPFNALLFWLMTLFTVLGVFGFLVCAPWEYM